MQRKKFERKSFNEGEKRSLIESMGSNRPKDQTFDTALTIMSPELPLDDRKQIVSELLK